MFTSSVVLALKTIITLAADPVSFRYDGDMPPAARYTPKQGQYLAFIYYYTKIHGVPPAEPEMQQYFGVTPPSVHQMILGLEERGLITRTPGMARSIRLTLSRAELPDLE